MANSQNDGDFYGKKNTGNAEEDRAVDFRIFGMSIRTRIRLRTVTPANTARAGKSRVFFDSEGCIPHVGMFERYGVQEIQGPSMPIAETEFDNEAELEGWAKDNLNLFLAGAIRLDGFRISTSSSKGGIPDGFAFNLADREWFVIECELLKHGVWPHIAEQITRFVVAVQTPASLRAIRDRLYDHILTSGLIDEASRQLESPPERLLQQIELFVEAVRPGIVIFIDDTNQDLTDFAHALDLPVQIFRFRKLNVNGKIECYSPDHKPVIETDVTDSREAGDQDWDVIEQLGGGKLVESAGRFKCYQLSDGRIIHVKRSKLHERQGYYWYGINPSVMDKVAEFGVTHIVFVMGTAGFVVVPVTTVHEYLKSTNATRNPDGSIRHYHVLISREPNPKMYWSADTPEYSLTAYFHPFS